MVARNGQPSEAIHHALAAGDFERVAGLVELIARATIRHSNQSARLLEWLKLVPDGVIRARPVLSTYYAFGLLGVGEMETAEARLSDAQRWLDSGVDTNYGPEATQARMVVVDREETELQSLPGTIALARSFRAQALGDVAGTVEQARPALNLLPKNDYVWRGGAALLLALAHWTNGDLEAAQRTHDDGIASLEKAGDVALASVRHTTGPSSGRCGAVWPRRAGCTNERCSSRARRCRTAGNGGPAPWPERWNDWLEGLAFTLESDGTTTLASPIADQAALHGVLNRIRDLNLPIVSVRRVSSDAERAIR